MVEPVPQSRRSYKWFGIIDVFSVNLSMVLISFSSVKTVRLTRTRIWLLVCCWNLPKAYNLLLSLMSILLPVHVPLGKPIEVMQWIDLPPNELLDSVFEGATTSELALDGVLREAQLLDWHNLDLRFRSLGRLVDRLVVAALSFFPVSSSRLVAQAHFRRLHLVSSAFFDRLLSLLVTCGRAPGARGVPRR